MARARNSARLMPAAEASILVHVARALMDYGLRPEAAETFAGPFAVEMACGMEPGQKGQLCSLVHKTYRSGSAYALYFVRGCEKIRIGGVGEEWLVGDLMDRIDAARKWRNRDCLRCRRVFLSKGAGVRMCDDCRAAASGIVE